MGSYRLGELLGRGGMGEVYQATHRMLARPGGDQADPARDARRAIDGASAQLAVARFRREAEAAAEPASPHTVELYDFGVTEDRTLYFVMELLEGMDLETLVRRHGPLPAEPGDPHPAAGVRVAGGGPRARAGAPRHQAGQHPPGPGGTAHDFVKVLDFGLVKSVAGGEPRDSLATAAGLTPGTPAYMAPGDGAGRDPVDGRADLYALGCVAYYLLTGQLVFEAENAFQMVAKHLSAEPVPPSVAGGVDLPPGLERLVLACLAKQPADRPDAARAGPDAGGDRGRALDRGGRGGLVAARHRPGGGG